MIHKHIRRYVNNEHASRKCALMLCPDKTNMFTSICFYRVYLCIGTVNMVYFKRTFTPTHIFALTESYVHGIYGNRVDGKNAQIAIREYNIHRSVCKAKPTILHIDIYIYMFRYRRGCRIKLPFESAHSFIPEHNWILVSLAPTTPKNTNTHFKPNINARHGNIHIVNTIT